MKLPPRTTPILAHDGEFLDRRPDDEITIRIRVDTTEFDRALKKLRAVAMRRRRPSAVRCFCDWLRDAGRWLNHGWGPAYMPKKESRAATPNEIGFLVCLVLFGLYVALVSLTDHNPLPATNAQHIERHP